MMKTTWQQVASHLVLALGVSALVVALLVRTSLSSTEMTFLPRLIEVITSVSGGYFLLYLLASGLRTIAQTLRYRLILQAMEPGIPGFLHLLLVTASRNMFVDMLPSRLGELSYAAMLNRGYAVSLPSCLASLAVGFIFDLGALALIIVGIVVYQLLVLGLQGWIVGVLLLVVSAFTVALILLFPGLQRFLVILKGVAGKAQGRFGRVLGRIVTFLTDAVAVLQKARHAGIIGRLILLSLVGRVGKYMGLYALFLGVVTSQFVEVNAHPVATIVALISAEAGASMPLPTFMGFGAYEAAGTLAMVSLGAEQSVSLLIMLGLHVLSQGMDYSQGGVALIVFFLTTRTRLFRNGTAPSTRFSWYTAWGLALFGAGALFLISEMAGVRKLGALRPPERGQEVLPAVGEGDNKTIDKLSGFAVWSSNRSGNHDIWMLSLPGRELKQLTTHPHTEYYPRISPDGSKVVFARSREPWVSQRNEWPWDVILLDLRTGIETKLVEYGNAPTWSADGRSVYFQRNGGQIVQLALASRKESVVLDSAHLAGLKASEGVRLQTPSVAPDGRSVAATLRGGMRATAILPLNGAARLAGDGCQLTWSPDGAFLYKVDDHGGRQMNAFFRLDPASRKAQLWFDAPGEYSHEYFPKLDRTGTVLVYGASTGGHEHDTADYEIFLWRVGQPAGEAVRLTHHTGNDCWPDIFLSNTNP